MVKIKRTGFVSTPVLEPMDYNLVLKKLLSSTDLGYQSLAGPKPEGMPAFKAEGDLVLLLGSLPGDLRGSVYLNQIHGLEMEPLSRSDADREQGSRIQELSIREVGLALKEQRLVQSAYNCAAGGLAIALAQGCIQGQIGAEIGIDPLQMLLMENQVFPGQRAGFTRGDVLFFGEDALRIVFSLNPKRLELVQMIAQKARIPLWIIGVVGGARLKIWGPHPHRIDLTVAEITQIWEEANPRCLNQR